MLLHSSRSPSAAATLLACLLAAAALCCTHTALAARTPAGLSRDPHAAASTALTREREDPQAHWPRAFSSKFNETTKLFFFSWHTKGIMYYDADQQAELVHRDNGRGDRYCGSIHPLTDTPCTHIVVGGNRYLFFHDLDECCLCCTAESGCGILDPNWLQGAEYIGQVTMQGRLANEWAIRGLQPNQYYATADDAEIPLELDQDPNAYISFHPDSYKPGPVPPYVFKLPGGGIDCSKKCPLASVCTIAALQGRVAKWLRMV